MYELKADLTSL